MAPTVRASNSPLVSEVENKMSDATFTQLVDSYYQPLYRFALSLTRRDADACDLTQQTFYVWATKGSMLRDASKVKSWLFTTLYREFLRTRRRDQRLTSIEDLSPNETDIADEEIDRVRKMDGAMVLDALSEVDEVFRAPVTLFYVEDFSYTEIAETLNVPLGTVMSRLSRGKLQLRSLLAAREKQATVVPFEIPDKRKKSVSHESWKFILGSYRANGADAQTPAFADALGEMEQNPDLKMWFERDQKFDAVVRTKLSEVVPPAHLRAAILTGARVGKPLPWWRRSPWMAMAASIALLLALTPFVARVFRPSTPLNLPEFAVNSATRGFVGLESGKSGGDLPALAAWLTEHRAPLPAKIPPGLAQLHLMGCGTIDYEGKDISVICFDHGREFHLFVARRSDFPGLDGASAPHFASHRGWGSAMWADAEHQYVLVSSAGVPAIKNLL